MTFCARRGMIHIYRTLTTAAFKIKKPPDRQSHLSDQHENEY